MLEFIKKRKIIIIIVAVIAIVALAALKLGSNGQVETTSPIVGDLARTVKISGKVTPRQSVELGFETSGTVTSISRDVGQTTNRGDVIARIDSSGTSANILKAEAELTLAQANLDKLNGAGIYEAQIDNAKRALIQTIIDTYTAGDNAVYNKTDPLFLNPYSGRPEIAPTFQGHYELRNSINKTRVIMGETLTAWKTLTTGLTPSTYTEERLTLSKKYLAEVSSYIADISQAVNMFEESGSLTQATIDAYKSDTATARNSLNNASQNLISAEDKFKGLLLEVPVQVAMVEAAHATLLNYRSELSKTTLVSPIDGIISRQEAKIGQVVSSNTSLVSIISKDFQIEAFIPEVLISGIKVGNTASITLDAYGEQDIFEAKIVHIDPAETIRDGVSTYKVKLAFSSPDERVRSGMTANVQIETFRKGPVRLIQERAVFRENSETFVYILSGENGQEKVMVDIGERDSMGNVELISNLPEESKLITNPSVN